jgi:ABC-type dipeptide/oligopeptide/nickel transport system permease subunit
MITMVDFRTFAQCGGEGTWVHRHFLHWCITVDLIQFLSQACGLSICIQSGLAFIGNKRYTLHLDWSCFLSSGIALGLVKGVSWASFSPGEDVRMWGLMDE